MGAWGPGIFSDDLAADIRGDYNVLLSVGKTGDEAEEMILSYYGVVLKQEDTADVFWFALALAEWNKGRLSQRAKENALKAIQSGRDLECWSEDQKMYQKRKAVLEKLEKTLTSEQPPEKKVKKLSVRRCPWKEGDLLAYRVLMDETLKESSVYNKYVLVRVLRVIKHPISKIMSTQLYNESMQIGLYGWMGEELPDPSIADTLEYIAIDHSNFSELEKVDLSMVEQYPEAIGKKILESVRNALKFKGTYCTELDWAEGRKKGDFTYLSNDPLYWDKVPPEIKNQPIQVMMGLYGFEVSIAMNFSSENSSLPNDNGVKEEQKDG